MQLFEIQAVERAGFKGVSRGGRHWPSDGPTLVEVHDQDQDPPIDNTKDKAPHVTTIHNEHPRRIGKATFALIQADRRLRIINSGDPMKVETVKVAALRKQFDAELERMSEIHSSRMKDMSERHIEEISEANKQIVALTARIQELEGGQPKDDAAPAGESKGEETKTPDEEPKAKKDKGAKSPK